MLRFFQMLGWDVIAVDDQPRKQFSTVIKELGNRHIEWVFGGARIGLLGRADIVVKNPGVPMEHPFIRAARSRGKIVTCDLDIFLAAAGRERVIGVTGTKGKTTTVQLIAHVLNGTVRADAVGVPGRSFFDVFRKKSLPAYIVAECSSYDLELTRVSPHVAVLTSLAGDHISRHGTMAGYTRAKSNLFAHQKKNDIAILPKHITHASAFLKTRARTLRYQGVPPRFIKYIPWNIHENSVAAAYAACSALSISDAVFSKRLRTFTPVPGRREEIYRTKNGIRCVNDTTATAPIAAIDTIRGAARAFGKARTIAIVGGHDKALVEKEIRLLARTLKEQTAQYVLLDGSFTKRLKKYLPKGASSFASMDAAVAEAMSRAKKGSVVILSPGCASFNMFRNEFDRGDRFRDAVVHY